MRIIRNLAVAIIVMVCITTQGCNEGQQAPPAPKTSPKTEKPVAMNYNIIDKDAFTVMGTQTRVTSADENNPDTYTKIWDAIEPYRTKLRPISVGWQFYGVTFATDKKDAFDYLAGMSVRSDATPLDANLVVRTVPAARYAVFKCASDNIGKTYQYIYSEWLPGSRYKIDANACCFEQYAPREWMNRPVFIYIPIKP
ncbi:MAG: GyrI-like domain-containing protein [Sedimentisphaerales bacterium]|jgi:predicted transcriptional regulator YdeE